MHLTGVLRVGQLNDVSQIVLQPILVALATKFWENLKTKVGYNSACIRDIADVLASNRVFWPETMNRVRQRLSDDTEVFILLVHYYHTVNLKNHVIRAN